MGVGGAVWPRSDGSVVWRADVWWHSVTDSVHPLRTKASTATDVPVFLRPMQVDHLAPSAAEGEWRDSSSKTRCRVEIGDTSGAISWLVIEPQEIELVLEPRLGDSFRRRLALTGRLDHYAEARQQHPRLAGKPAEAI
jgi:hypothetical protein